MIKIAAGDIEIYQSTIEETSISDALTGQGITAADTVVTAYKGNDVFFVVIKAA